MIGYLRAKSFSYAPFTFIYFVLDYLPTHMKMKTVVLIGKTGTGKSSTANLLCGQQLFKSECSAALVTQEYQAETFNHGDNMNIRVVDSPGVFGSLNDFCIFKPVLDELKTIGISAFLLVISLVQRLTSQDLETIQFFDSTLGEKWSNFGIIVFTNANKFEDENDIHAYIKSFSQLYQTIQYRFENRYIIIDNKRKDYLDREKILKFIKEFIAKHDADYTIPDMLGTTTQIEEIDESIGKFEGGFTKIPETVEIKKQPHGHELRTSSEEKENSVCRKCESNPTFICKECDKMLCTKCNKNVHKQKDVASSHTVKPISEFGSCCFCEKQTILRICCASCKHMCGWCKDFHQRAFPDHKQLPVYESKYDDTIPISCTNDRYESVSFCFDCNNLYCASCRKHHKSMYKDKQRHFIVDNVALMSNPRERLHMETIKCVIEVSDIKTDFRLYFPYYCIYSCEITKTKDNGKEKKTKRSSPRNPFFAITSMALFFERKIVSIGTTAHCQHKVIENLENKEQKNKWIFKDIWKTQEDKKVYYRRLFHSLKSLWFKELIRKFHEIQVNISESTIELFLYKTAFVSNILKEYIDEKEIGLPIVEDITPFSLVHKDERDNFLYD